MPRGYYFDSPVDLTITGVTYNAAIDEDKIFQAEILKYLQNDAPHPTNNDSSLHIKTDFSSDNFEILYQSGNQTSKVTGLNIDISIGDVIAIVGNFGVDGTGGKSNGELHEEYKERMGLK